VDVLEVDPGSEIAHIRLGIVEAGSSRVRYIGLDDIVSMVNIGDNLQIINDWLYWHNFDLLPEE
jgi:hypothetical protein